MHHKIDTPAAVRYSALFPAFEADAMVATIKHEPVGEDGTADHGMPSEPSSADRRHFSPSIIDLLNNRFDPAGKQLVTAFEPENLQIFVDEERLLKLGLTLPDLAKFLRSLPFLCCAFTGDEVRLAAAIAWIDRLSQRCTQL
jgi:hypothetical protein